MNAETVRVVFAVAGAVMGLGALAIAMVLRRRTGKLVEQLRALNADRWELAMQLNELEGAALEVSVDGLLVLRTTLAQAIAQAKLDPRLGWSPLGSRGEVVITLMPWKRVGS